MDLGDSQPGEQACTSLARRSHRAAERPRNPRHSCSLCHPLHSSLLSYCRATTKFCICYGR